MLVDSIWTMDMSTLFIALEFKNISDYTRLNEEQIL